MSRCEAVERTPIAFGAEDIPESGSRRPQAYGEETGRSAHSGMNCAAVDALNASSPLRCDGHFSCERPIAARYRPISWACYGMWRFKRRCGRRYRSV